MTDTNSSGNIPPSVGNIPPSVGTTPPSITTPQDNDICKNKATRVYKKPEVKSEEGSETCKQLNQTIENIKTHESASNIIDSIGNAISNVVVPFAGIANNIIDAVKPKNETESWMVNHLKNNISNSDITNIQSICNNIITSKQSNIIKTGGPECMNAIANVCNIYSSDQYKSECVDNMREQLRVENVNMTNTATAKNTCVANQIINKLMKSSSSIDNLSIIKALQDAQGLGSKNTNSSINCTDISNNISSEQFLDNYSCCLNKIQIDQENLIEGCGLVSNVNLSNKMDPVSDCLMSNDIITKSEANVTTNNKGDNTADQKSDNTAILGMSGLSCAVVVIILGGIALLFAANYFLGGKKAKMSKRQLDMDD